MPWIIVTVPGRAEDPVPYADKHQVLGWPHGMVFVQKRTRAGGVVYTYEARSLDGGFVYNATTIEAAASGALRNSCPARQPSRCKCWQP